LSSGSDPRTTRAWLRPRALRCGVEPRVALGLDRPFALASQLVLGPQTQGAARPTCRIHRCLENHVIYWVPQERPPEMKMEVLLRGSPQAWHGMRRSMARQIMSRLQVEP